MNSCITCNQKIELDDALTCDKCLNYFHCTCQSITKAQHGYMKKLGNNINWFCKQCKEDTKYKPLPADSAQGINKQLEIIIKRIDNVDNMHKLIDKQIEAIKEIAIKIEKHAISIEKLENITKLLETKLNNLIAEQKLNKQACLQPALIHQTTQKQSTVNNDYRFRIRVAGIPESTKASTNERTQEDLEHLNVILQHLGNSTTIIKNIYRVRKYDANRIKTSKRITIVELTTIWDRRLIISKAAEMKTFNIPKIFISYDLSEEDRLIEKKGFKKAL